MKRQRMKRWMAAFLSVVTAVTMTLGQTPVTVAAINGEITSDSIPDESNSTGITAADGTGSTEGTGADTGAASQSGTQGADTEGLPQLDAGETNAEVLQNNIAQGEDADRSLQSAAENAEGETPLQGEGIDDSSAEAASAQETGSVKNRYAVFEEAASVDINDIVSYEVTYIGEDDDFSVYKTDDFSLKYQVDLNFESEVDAETLTLRIPRRLLTDRDGNAVYPTAVAVPERSGDGTSVASRVTPFNYYVDEETDELVFYNYKKITEGSSSNFQVAYGYQKAMNIADGTTWSLTPNLTLQKAVEGEETPRELTLTAQPLTGSVDTRVQLDTVTKRAYKDPSGASVTPGLYNKSQVCKYLRVSELPEPYAGHFDDYVYAVWQVSLTGTATQPWDLYIEDTSSTKDGVGGQLVGFNRPAELQGVGRYRLAKDEKQTNLEDLYKSSQLLVVTAYPKGAVSEGVQLDNTVTLTLHPVDGIDGDVSQSADASWAYSEYRFVYPQGWVSVAKKSFDPRNSSYVLNETPSYDSWLEQYRRAREAGEDTDGLRYRTQSESKTYAATHDIDSRSETFGTYIPDTWAEISTVDDVLRLQDEQGKSVMLGSGDYYYSEVTVSVRDKGLDPWNGTAAPSDVNDAQNKVPLDRTMKVYAMFAGSTAWEEVAVTDWEESGSMSYAFSESDIARQPWRVKVAHNAADDTSVCTIDVNVCMRANSDAMKDAVGEATMQVTAENLSGVIYKWHKADGTVDWINKDKETNGAYPTSSELCDITRNLYEGELIQRGNAYEHLVGLEKDAAAFKDASAVNDPVNARVSLSYHLTAYESYLVYNQDAVAALSGLGLDSPARKEVVFYDLLPLGVKFDPSVPIKAGRITNLDNKGNFKKQPNTWDASQVRLSMNSTSDIIQNYRGTGRTRIAFHLTYEGEDPSVYTQFRWLEGWGVSFGAYYDWRDADLCKDSENISAFMPAPADNTALLGTVEQVAMDDGVILPSSLQGTFQAFGADIDGDGVTDVRNVLYAEAGTSDDIVIASEARIEKTVRADDNRFGVFADTANVNLNSGYTYDINIKNKAKEMQDIVIYDRLEYANHDNVPGTTDMPETSWTGIFTGVQTADLKKLGIIPQVYYNASQDAAVTDDTNPDQSNPGQVLTADNGWLTAEKWEEEGHLLSEVRAVAVDISQTAEGPFILDKYETVSLQICMTSPASMPVDADSAYNNARFYSRTVGEGDERTVLGNTAKVYLQESRKLEVRKSFEGDIPSARKSSIFTFTAKVDGRPFATREYTLWEQDSDGTYVQAAGSIYTTAADGSFSLKAGQKAVFTTADADKITVTEQESPFWKQTVEDTAEEGGLRSLSFVNRYQPVLYAQKELKAVPADLDVTGESFTYQILCEGKPAANSEFWYVTSVRTDGGTPKKDTTQGEEGVGYTDAEGKFTIQAGQIIALRPGAVGEVYTLIETDPGENWVCENDTAEGTLTVNGTQATMTNLYKWKNLNLTKKLTHQSVEDCRESFTFQVKADGAPLAGYTWELLNSNGTPVLTELGLPVTGTLDNEGKLTAACAGKVIRIRKVAAGSSFTIQEIDIPENYKPDTDTVSGTMPVYAEGKDVTITNEYLLRDLSVTKTVTNADKLGNVLKDKTFTMTVRLDGELLADMPYTVSDGGILQKDDTLTTNANGEFTIKHGQTVTFPSLAQVGTPYEVVETPDADYPPVSPQKNVPIKGKIGDNGSKASFLNGQASDFVIEKKYVAGEDDSNGIVEYFVQYGSIDVTLTLRVTDFDGSVYTWPKKDTEVTITRSDGSDPQTKTWRAASTFNLTSNHKIIIPGGISGVSYRLSEAKANQLTLQLWPIDDNNFLILEAKQISPANMAPVKGDLATSKEAVLVNEMSGRFLKSVVGKLMTEDSTSVPEGKKLVFEVQRKNGEKWESAGGIHYYDMTNFGTEQYIGRGLQTTGDDGLIQYVKSLDDDIPTFAFVGDAVSIDSAGDLRIIERTDLSDPEWGRFCGYADENGNDLGMEPTEEAVAFVNDNTTRKIEIEKQMSTTGSETFTFYLNQVTEATASKVTQENQIAATQPGAYLPYTVYDSQTGEQAGTGVTNAEGEVQLKAGQYASLDVPKHTIWTVSEKKSMLTELKDASGTGTETEKLKDNLMVIGLDHALREGTFTKDMYTNGYILAVKDYENGDLETERIAWDPAQSELELSIPEYIYDDQTDQYYRITSVGDSAFASAKPNLTLTLPDSVESIGKNAFSGSNLVSIAFGNGVKSMGEGAFMNCKSLTHIDLPDGLTKIPTKAFYGSGLTALTVGENVTSIGDYGFDDCSNLKKVQLPSGLQSIGRYAFADNTLLTDINLQDTNLTSMGENAFYQCTSLSGVNLPDTLTVIPTSAFNNCTNLEQIILGQALTSIGSQAFYNCTSLAKIYYTGSEQTKSFELPETLTSIGGKAFSKCTSLEGEIVFPGNCRNLGDYIFDGDTKITSAVIPDGMTGVPTGIFKGCSALSTVSIPNTVTSIGHGAFYNCSELSTISLPSGLKEIGNTAFYSCKNLQGLELPQTLTTIGQYAFFQCKLSGEVVLDQIESIGESAFRNSTITKIVLSGPITEISKDAFYDCSALTSVTLPEGLMSIGERAFAQNAKLTEITIPSTVTTIASKAFEKDSNMKITVKQKEGSIIGAAWGAVTGSTVIWEG